MEKYLEYPRYDADGRNNIEVVRFDELEKVASADYDKEIREKVMSLVPDDRYMWVLVTALGATPPWPQNVNGDIFPEEALLGMQSADEAVKNPDKTPKIRYKTFEDGHVFAHHSNKDPNKSFGSIELSTWNDKMKRVELILKIDRSKNPSICEKIDRNDTNICLSMGCKVAKDQCSICKHWARRRNPKFPGDPDAYCEHLRYQMGKILPDGRQVGAINWHPRYFDISFVLIGADRTSLLLKRIDPIQGPSQKKEIPPSPPQSGIEKIASHPMDFAEKLGMVSKRADIDKEIEGGQILSSDQKKVKEVFAKEILPRLKSVECDIPNESLDDISKYPLNKILTTMSLSGIIPNPREFQRIILVKIDKKDMADDLDRNNIIFQRTPPSDDLSRCLNIRPETFDRSLFRALSPYLDNRSSYGPFITKRIIKVITLPKPSPRELTEESSPILDNIGSIYSSYRKGLPRLFPDIFRKFMSRYPEEASSVSNIGLGGSCGLNSTEGIDPINLRKALDIFNEIDYDGPTILRIILDKDRILGNPFSLYTSTGY